MPIFSAFSARFSLFAWIAQRLVFHIWYAFIRGYAVRPKQTPLSTHLGLLSSAISDGVTDVYSDSGTAPSTESTRVAGRLPRQAHCIWLSGPQANSLSLTPCPGRHAMPPTLLYDDWFIQDGTRLHGPNFPLSAELCPQRRLDYDAH